MDLIDSLLPEKELVYELVVVIDHDDPLYARAVEDKYTGVFNKMVVCTQSNAGRAATRNKGVDLCTGELVVFFDDDMILETGTIKKHVDFHEKNKGQILVGSAYRDSRLARCDFSKFLILTEKRWRKDDPRAVKEICFRYFTFTSANMSIPKSVFVSLGGLNNKFKLAIEDTDMGMRALKAKVKVTHNEDVLAWHNDWPDLEGFIKRSNEYIEAKNMFIEQNPAAAEIMPQFVLKRSAKLKRMILSAVRMFVCPAVLNEKTVFRFFPLKTKFFFYDLAISATSKVNL
jgi:GT2 family glycosyltransferase